MIKSDVRPMGSCFAVDWCAVAPTQHRLSIMCNDYYEHHELTFCILCSSLFAPSLMLFKNCVVRVWSSTLPCPWDPLVLSLFELPNCIPSVGTAGSPAAVGKPPSEDARPEGSPGVHAAQVRTPQELKRVPVYVCGVLLRCFTAGGAGQADGQ